MHALLEHPLARVLIALAIGLLVGAERERRKKEQPGIAGIRTYGLAGLLGGICGYEKSVWLIAIGGAFVGAMAIAGYLRAPKRDVGTTTEIALVVTYVLGVLSVSEPGLASGVAMVMTALLALRTRMHTWVNEALTQEELLDGLVLGIAAFVVLPLLPDRNIGPFGGVHPPTLWRLVVVMMALSGAGYVAQRVLGPRYGIPLAGVAGGFVSSSATIAAMGTRAKEDPHVAKAAAAGAACSTIATVVQLAIMVGAANRGVLRACAIPLGAAGVAAIAYGGFLAWRGAHATKGDAPSSTEPAKEKRDGKRPRAFKFSSALFFALLVGAVTLAAKFASARFGAAGLLVAVGVAAFADAHSAAASAAASATEAAAGAAAVLLAMSTNSLTKIVLAFTSGPRGFAMRVSVGVVLVLACAWAAFVIV